MTGREAAERDADKAETAQITAEKEKEAAIDDETLPGVASEKEDNSDHSSVREVVFSTPISPPRGTMLPPARPTTPETEVARKRSFTLVHRTPEKPREAPVAPTTH